MLTGKHFPSEKDDCKRFEKNNVAITLNVFMLKKKKYILLMFQKITQTVKNKLFFLWFQTKKSYSIIKRNNFEKASSK